MEEKNYIIQLCQEFKDRKYDLVDFQKRMETANFPEELVEFKQWILNEIEEIRYTKLETNYYDYGLEVVNLIFKNFH